MEMDKQREPLRALFPQLSEAELVEVAERLDPYVTLALVIYEGIVEDPERHAPFRRLLDAARRNGKNGDAGA